MKTNSQPNSDIALEQAVLGSILIDSTVLTKYSDKLSVELFTDKRNQCVFGLISQLWEQQHPIDLVIVSNLLQKSGKDYLTNYLIDLSLKVSSSANLEYYVMCLVELAVKRDFGIKFQSLIAASKQPDIDIFDLREQTFRYFDALFIDRFIDRNKASLTFPQLVEKVQDRFEGIINGAVPGLKASLSIINRAFGGWQNSDLTIIAGRPGMGKTAFMVQNMVDAAKQGIGVGAFSLEMSAEQITARLITNYTGITNTAILRKGLSVEQVDLYWSLKDELVDLKFYIDDTPAISIQNLRVKAKMMKMRYGIGLLFVDYLQLVTTQSKTANREQEITGISQGLKKIAKELDIPLIALSQLNRKVEQRPDKRPMLSDLRDSGSIEQDADEVIFLYRPEYYGIDLWEEEYGHGSTKNEAEIIIAKNRQGGLLFNRVKVDMATSRFYDCKDGDFKAFY